MKSDFDEKAALKLCRNKDTPAGVLKTHVGKSVKLDRLIAQHHNADASVLGGLSGSLDIKTFEYLLLNSHTPFETILAIASSLISGKDRSQRFDEIYAELKTLLAGEEFEVSCDSNRITVEELAVLPPGVQRTYRLPDSKPTVRKLLQDYLKNPDREQLAIQMAKDKKTSADVLAALLGCSISIDRLIAKHPNANERVLDELTGNKEEGTTGSKDKVIRRNAFLNPNIRLPAIVEMASEFPNDFIKHPTLDRLATGERWTGPGIIYRIGQSLLLKILARRDCPQTLLDWACKHGGPLEQLAAWKNIFTPVELLAEMMATGYAQEANVLLAHPDKLIEFAGDLGIVDYDLDDVGSCGKLTQSGLFYVFDDELSALWEKLVPEEGEAETIQGEMVRAIGRIKGDYYRNGFGNWYPMYYKLSQFLAAHLIDESTFKPFTLSVLHADIRALNAYGNSVMAAGSPYEQFHFSLFKTTGIEEAFERLDAAIAVWCKRHPELIPYKRSN